MPATDASAVVPVSESSGDGRTRTRAWGFTALLVALYVVNWGDKAVLGLAAQPLAAVRAGTLYVVTHDEALEPLRRRFQRLEDAIRRHPQV